MTHVPPQFRMPQVLIDEWRRRADECRMTDPAAAEAYDRCADELCELDVHTETATDGTPLHAPTAFAMDRVAPWLAAGALGAGVLGLLRGVARRRAHSGDTLRRAPLVADPHDVTPPHGDKLLRQMHS